MKRGSWIKLLAVVIVTAVVSLTLWIVYPSEEEGNPDLVAWNGLQAGERFKYDIAGIINGTAVHGYFESGVDQDQYSRWRYPVNTSDQALSDVMAYWSYWFSPNPQVGQGVIETPFGTKQVVCTFAFDFAWSGYGLATISYWGTDPVVQYGFVINGPDVHLDLVMVETNSKNVMSSNFHSFDWQDENGDGDYETQGGGWLDHSYGTQGKRVYLADPGRMEFNITGNDADVFVFATSNMVSMAEGGPFSYLLGATMLHMGNYSGETVVPSGLSLIYFRETGEEGGRYDFKIEKLET
jgi:hypothetical protein